MKKEIMIDDLELFNEVLKDVYKSYKKEINNLEIENHNKKKIDILINKRKFVSKIITSLKNDMIPQYIISIIVEVTDITYHKDSNYYTIGEQNKNHIKLEMKDGRYLRIELKSSPKVIENKDIDKKEEDFINSKFGNEHDFLLDSLYNEDIIYDIDIEKFDKEYLLKVIEELKLYI